ncbi:MAG: Cof-type HAD-IIB family hydrolase [Anaerolineaceae bacterium]|nr:Cof-type HAD-IIB family hydrolase [Anaerolineaceae bacterium]
MAQIKLIAIDLDGTLLADHYHISKKNIAAVRKATDNGVPVYLISGRATFGMEFAAEALGLTTPLIAYNGAFIFDPTNQEVVYSRSLQREMAKRAIEIFRQKDIYVGYYAGMNWYADKLCKEMRAEGKALNRNPEVVDNLVDAELPGPHKLIAIEFNDENKLQDAYKELRRTLLDLNAHFSETFALEIFDQQVSKAAALQYILNLQGLTVDNLLVIGDNFNDISMMQLAGVSVAVENAPEEVKTHADWIVPSNKDHGVAIAIERLFA